MWYEEAEFYQVFPLGFCDGLRDNDGVMHRCISEFADWIPHLQKLGTNAVYFSPLFESDYHGYDTRDYRVIDKRIGTNKDFAELVAKLHEAGIKVVIDGVFNHVGRGFFAFKDVCEKKWDSAYKDWFNIGEDKLCTVCTEYPRFTETYGSLTEKGLGMSCESAAEFIFKSDKPTGFETEKFDYEEECDEDFLRILLNVRENIFDVLKNRKMNISDRVKTILNYAYDVQDKINNNNVDKVPQSVDNCDFSQSEKCINDIKECVKLCLSLEIMEDSWTGVIENTLGIFDNYDNLSGEFDLYISGREYEYENLLVYFIYRYLLKAVFDCDVLTKVRFAAVSYVIIRQLDIARWLRNGKEFSLKDRIKNCVLYSKEVEHCQDNIDFFDEEFLFNPIFEHNRFLNLI